MIPGKYYRIVNSPWGDYPVGSVSLCEYLEGNTYRMRSISGSRYDGLLYWVGVRSEHYYVPLSPEEEMMYRMSTDV